MKTPDHSFLSLEELKQMPFRKIGKNVLISRTASFYNMKEMVIGNNVRIDDFCLLSGNVRLGSNIHISAYCALYGKFGIEMKDYSGLSPRSSIFSATDDFNGEYLIGPIHDPSLTNVTGGRVTIEKYVQIGTGSIILPDLIIREGAVTGAFSLVNKSLEGWGIYVGIPARKIKNRSKTLLGKI